MNTCPKCGYPEGIYTTGEKCPMCNYLGAVVGAIQALTDLLEDDCPAKFSVGQEVKFFHLGLERQGKIIGKNAALPAVEYAIEGYPFLIWEDEITEVMG